MTPGEGRLSRGKGRETLLPQASAFHHICTCSWWWLLSWCGGLISEWDLLMWPWKSLGHVQYILLMHTGPARIQGTGR